MSKIKVHLLNYCFSSHTHIEILLEDLEDIAAPSGKHYLLNRWAAPKPYFIKASYAARGCIRQYIQEASNHYQFDIDANPEEIVREWEKYYQSTLEDAGVTGNNCAVATEWFLTKFANIPPARKLGLPLSFNYLTFGIFVPSFLPMGITLPGRVFDNAEFYISVRQGSHPGIQKSNAALNISIAVAAITVIGSIVAVVAASLFLTGVIGVLAIAAGCVAALAATHGLFKGINMKAAKEMHIVRCVIPEFSAA